jgi:hypothetical protein
MRMNRVFFVGDLLAGLLLSEVSGILICASCKLMFRGLGCGSLQANSGSLLMPGHTNCSYMWSLRYARQAAPPTR